MPSPASRFLRLTLSNLQPNFAPIHSVPVGLEAAGALRRAARGLLQRGGAHRAGSVGGRWEAREGASGPPCPAETGCRGRQGGRHAGREAGRPTRTGSQAGRWIDIKPCTDRQTDRLAERARRGRPPVVLVMAAVRRFKARRACLPFLSHSSPALHPSPTPPRLPHYSQTLHLAISTIFPRSPLKVCFLSSIFPSAFHSSLSSAHSKSLVPICDLPHFSS